MLGLMLKSFLINDDIKAYENIRKIATGQGEEYTTSCLLKRIIKWLQ